VIGTSLAGASFRPGPENYLLAQGYGSFGGPDLPTGTLTAALAKQVGPDVVSQGLDKFIRTTKGGQEVLGELGLYANLPYFVAGFAAGFILGRYLKR
jgi:hypothetical protein